MNLLAFVQLSLLFCWTSVCSKKIGDKDSRLVTKTKERVPLNTANDSVDDMYFGCRDLMETKIKNTFSKKEFKTDFSGVWKNAQTCANRKTNKKLLNKNHRQAICVYTSNYKMFYARFNEAVRTQRKVYGTSFPYHFIYFWLTDAVQILNKEKECLTTYRRSTEIFTGEVGQLVCFGSFTSSSKLTNLTRFGTETCFQIKTCLGAYLEDYPALKNTEEEVLIPPYEVFIISKKQTTGRYIIDCKTVYCLEYAGVLSNLNCHAVKNNITDK
uniref:NAD(P)(+)--arginine ADP-ribosyltransferase n=1 Tax=Oryzias melastigma TaxID=30732 RepID=A0A3B3BLY4_ORYME